MLTRQELVLVHEVGHAEVDCAEDENERLNNAVKNRDREDEDCLRVHDAVVDQWRRVELGEV